MGKLPGKTEYSGRRRSVTRKSGFKSHPDSTESEYRVESVPAYELPAGDVLAVNFRIRRPPKGAIVGFGGWYFASEKATGSILRGFHDQAKFTLTPPSAPDWSKVGSMWESDGRDILVSFEIRATTDTLVAVWEMKCGVIAHKHLEDARVALLGNMFQFSPESHFIADASTTQIRFNAGAIRQSRKRRIELYLKSCNRCARFLPVNVRNERNHLSFSNHCLAAHRVPCRHKGFGLLTNADDGSLLKLVNGFQLECRYCKKFEVNAAHNPKRTAAQMKEDAARRRAFELLLMDLYGGSAQMMYKYKNNGRELADDIWEKFERRCFNCGTVLTSANVMHLDHTRPLALLWPLDETATALCGSCNSQKRDRYPADFYSDEALRVLSEVTGLKLRELKDPAPNMDAVERLGNRIDWFFSEFLTKPELTKERDGKTASELLVKALQKVLEKCRGGPPFDLSRMFESRRKYEP